jgi:hypothetical protein
VEKASEGAFVVTIVSDYSKGIVFKKYPGLKFSI